LAAKLKMIWNQQLAGEMENGGGGCGNWQAKDALDHVNQGPRTRETTQWRYKKVNFMT